MKKLLYTILMVLIILFLILLYSRFIGTQGLKTNEIILSTNILESYDGLKIVHFSDLHYKKVIQEGTIQKVIEAINETKPDIVLFTGDLLDKDYSIDNTDINFLIKELSLIQTKYGFFAILGDHDYQHEEDIRNIYIQSNVTLLENTYTIVSNEQNDKIFIGGLGSVLENKANISEINQDMTEEDRQINTKIFLVHEPDYLSNILNTFPDTSIILAGHSINGSMNIPLLKQFLLPKGAKTYYKPYYKIKNTDVYISNGIGVNQVNFRLLNTPSINFYRLKKDSES